MTLDVFCFKENELYGSALPKTIDDLEQLSELGIKVIISLEEAILNLKFHSSLDQNFEHHELFITDYDIPEKEQVEKFLEIIENARRDKKPVLVHCYAGCGRTGVMLAIAEKIIYGNENGEKAIANLRTVRPCSVETQNQIEFVKNYTREKKKN